MSSKYARRSGPSFAPSITWNTGRLQSVARDENHLYYDLISAFDRKTRIPVLLNTSYNENEPIVNTPAEAIDCFKRTKMDVLAMGHYFSRKTSDG